LQQSGFSAQLDAATAMASARTERSSGDERGAVAWMESLIEEHEEEDLGVGDVDDDVEHGFYDA
jgi:hypothetical protein